MPSRPPIATPFPGTRLPVRAALAALACAACASAPPAAREVEPLPSSIRVETVAETDGERGSLPPLPMSQVQEPSAAATRITLKASDDDLRSVLEEIANGVGLGYDLAPEVQGRVSTRLSGVTLTHALEQLLHPRGYAFQVQEGVLRVAPTPIESRIFSLDYVSLSRFGTATTVIQRHLGGGGRSRAALGTGGVAGGVAGGGFGGADVISSVTVADLWQEIQVALEGLVFTGSDTVSGPGETTAQPVDVAGGAGRSATGPYSRSQGGRRLIINPIAGTIMVTAPAIVLAEVETYLRAFEASVHRQVLIEAKLVEVSLDRQFEFGIDWRAIQRIGDLSLRFGQPQTQGLQLLLEHGEDEIGAVLTALDTQGDVRVLSSPRVSMLNNQRAVINITTDEVFFAVTRQPIIGPQGQTIGFTTDVQPQQISVGIVLDVLAQVSADNSITLNVRPMVTDVIRVEELRLEDGTQMRAPVIDRRETDTVARLRDGETIVIGGLMQTRRSTNVRGVPLLKDVPWLGRLFSVRRERETKQELVIFVTPTIIAGESVAGR